MRFGMMAMLAATMMTTVACFTEASFTEQYDQAFCDLNFECLDAVILEFYGWETTQDCIDAREEDAEAEPGGMEVCSFDSEVAQACLDELAAVSCEDYRENIGFDSCSDTCQ